MPAIRVLLCIVAVLCLTSCAFASLTNGGFESTPDFTGWNRGYENAEIDIQRKSNVWIPITVKFNSGPYNQAVMYLGNFGRPYGRCWFDNLVPSGFSITNPSFESVSGNTILGWGQDGIGTLTYSSTEHAASGSRSALFFDPTAQSDIRMYQTINLSPNTDYSYTFDFYMEEDYQGGIRCPVFSLDYSYYMGGLFPTTVVDDLVADRAAYGDRTCRMTLTGGQASVDQTVNVTSGVHMEAVANIKRESLSGGDVTLYVEDAQTGAVLGSAVATTANNLWQQVNVRFIAPTQVRVRVVATGTGKILVDSCSVTSPVLSPPAQVATWKTAADDLVLPPSLGYTISGSYTNILLTGINMLRSDLNAKSVTLGQTGSQPALFSISTGIGDSTKPEAYHLSVDSSGVTIEAPTERGAFYGLMTALQLIGTNASGQNVIIGCDIDDWPDLPWRSINRGPAGQTPDWMARHKLNTAMHITTSLMNGSPDETPDLRAHAMRPIPHENIVHQHQWFGVWDPNLCEGRAQTDELTLPGTVKVELTQRNVINPVVPPAPVPVSIANSSFESPSIPLSEHSRVVVPMGWSVLANLTSVKVVSDAASVGVPAAPDGAQFVASTGSNTFLHQNTGLRIQANKTYTLTAYVSGGVQGNQSSLMLGGSSTPTGPFDMSLLGWNTLTVGPTAWQNGTVSIKVQPGNSLIGKYLCVVLRSQLGWAMFDNVSVTVGSESSPVTVTNMTGTLTYAKDVDYIVTLGETVVPYPSTATPYKIERKAGGAIADGQRVKVTYEYVPANTPFTLCLGEMEPQNQMAEWVKNEVRTLDVDVIGLHVSEVSGIIGTGPRSRAISDSPPRLLADYYEKLDNSVKQAKPTCKILSYADDYMDWQNGPASGLSGTAPLLPDDMILQCWWYSPSFAVDYNKQSANLWTSLGHEFLLTSWYDYLNIHITAAAARWALLKGMPCLGTSSWAYNTDPNDPTMNLWMIEAADCAWRVPRPGENGYFDFEGAAENTHTQSQLGALSMHIGLADFAGDKKTKPISVELLQNGLVKRQAVITLGSDNNCFIADMAPDTYEVRVTASNFLRKVVHDVVVPTSGTGTMTTMLVNGDVDSDNSISDSDVSAVTANLDQTGAVSADLDGDGKATTTDLSIVLKNIGSVSD